MSANKYANLPDIDTAQDVYESEDVLPSAQNNKGDDSDDDVPARLSALRAKNAPGTDELDNASFDADAAAKKFRKAEKRRTDRRQRTHYAYPPSPASPSSPQSPSESGPATIGSSQLSSYPLTHRLRLLHTELTALEGELADPANPRLHAERERGGADPGELIRELVDVRSRLDRIRGEKEGRGRLVGIVTGTEELQAKGDADDEKKSDGKEARRKGKTDAEGEPSVRSIAEMDKRVGELEELVGSSSTALDESSPLPPPLLPLLTRLNAQMTLLTQPRHIDSVSRRLKLLSADLDRVSTSSGGQQNVGNRRQSGHHQHTSSSGGNAPAGPAPLSEQLLPMLTRLTPALPHIPHILTRLRTLSALHTGAAEFQRTLSGLEEEQRKTRDALKELQAAVETVEKSLSDNQAVVKGNVEGLEERVQTVLERLEVIGKQ